MLELLSYAVKFYFLSLNVCLWSILGSLVFLGTYFSCPTPPCFFSCRIPANCLGFCASERVSTARRRAVVSSGLCSGACGSGPAALGASVLGTSSSTRMDVVRLPVFVPCKVAGGPEPVASWALWAWGNSKPSGHVSIALGPHFPLPASETPVRSALGLLRVPPMALIPGSVFSIPLLSG